MGAASPQPPLVLIHGAFQTAATWDLVAPRLEAAGGRCGRHCRGLGGLLAGHQVGSIPLRRPGLRPRLRCISITSD